MINKGGEQPEKKFEEFLEKLKERGFDLKIFDRKKIANKYGQGLYQLLIAALFEVGAEINTNKFSFIFDEKERRIAWASERDENRVVVNLARSAGTPEFKDAIRKADKEIQLLKEEFKVH